jgi:hypothetical protein
VGTGSPGYLLEVSRNTAGDAVAFTASTDRLRPLVFSSSDNTASGSVWTRKIDSAFGVHAWSINSSERARIDSSGNLGVGVTSPATASFGNVIRNKAPAGGGASGYFAEGANSDTWFGIYSGTGTSDSAALVYPSTGSLRIATTTGVGVGGFSERLRIDSSGRLLVGTSTASNNIRIGQKIASVTTSDYGGASLTSYAGTTAAYRPVLDFQRSRGTTDGSFTAVADNDFLGTIVWRGSDGAQWVDGAYITAQVDGTPGANDMPGRLVFSTTADGASSPTERMRIAASGKIAFGGQGAPYASAGCDSYNNVSGEFAHVFRQDHASGYGIGVGIDGTYLAYFYSNKDLSGSPVGSITQNGSATAYNTSSDYRLKENVVPLTGAIDRVNQLQVHRFNFIADPDRTVDGFIAHEAQEVVPECVTGEKDAVDDEGNPVYQGIDQSKLVPLLTAALQEALAKIEALEAKVAALEGN